MVRYLDIVVEKVTAIFDKQKEGTIIVSKTIGEVVFNGSGLDDMSNGGEFAGEEDITYLVKIDGIGTPDTFKWSKDAGVTWIQEAVDITGLYQILDNGVTIKFNATTGHTLNAEWSFIARSADPAAILKNTLQVNIGSLAPGGSIIAGPFDMRNVEDAALTISTGYHASATLGIKVEVLTSPDNTDFDTEDTDAWASVGLEPSFLAGGTKQRTSNLNTKPIRFMNIRVTNLDGAFGTVGTAGVLTKLDR